MDLNDIAWIVYLGGAPLFRLKARAWIWKQAMLVAGIALLTGCAGQVPPAQPASPDCAPPALSDLYCYSPGGGVTRCQLDDGTYWDIRPDGSSIHWRYGTGDPNQAVTICTVEAQ